MACLHSYLMGRVFCSKEAISAVYKAIGTYSTPWYPSSHRPLTQRQWWANWLWFAFCIVLLVCNLYAAGFTHTGALSNISWFKIILRHSLDCWIFSHGQSTTLVQYLSNYWMDRHVGDKLKEKLNRPECLTPTVRESGASAFCCHGLSPVI